MNIILLSLNNDIGKKRRSKINYDYELFIGTSELDKCEDHILKKMTTMYNCNKNLYKGKCCHFDSMVLILKKIVKEELNNVIVCEDDAILKYIPQDLITHIMCEPILLNCRLHHPNSWKKDTLDYRIKNIVPLVKEFNNGINDIDYNLYRWSCSACIYYPTYQSAQKLLDFIYQQKSYTMFDLLLSKHKYFKYLYYPSPFSIEDDNTSQIGTPNGIIDNYLRSNEIITK